MGNFLSINDGLLDLTETPEEKLLQMVLLPFCTNHDMQKMWIAKTYNYKAEVFSNGLEAENYLDSNVIDNPKETYLILLDLNMPIMNGWEFLKVFEKKNYAGQVSIVIVTSSKFREDYERAKKSPLVIDFQNKPIGPNCLQKFIKEGELQIFSKKMG